MVAKSTASRTIASWYLLHGSHLTPQFPDGSVSGSTAPQMGAVSAPKQLPEKSSLPVNPPAKAAFEPQAPPQSSSLSSSSSPLNQPAKAVQQSSAMSTPLSQARVTATVSTGSTPVGTSETTEPERRRSSVSALVAIFGSSSQRATSPNETVRYVARSTLIFLRH